MKVEQIIGTREVLPFEAITLGALFDAPLHRSLGEMVCTHLTQWTVRDINTPLLIVGYAAAQLELRGNPRPWQDESRPIRYLVTQVCAPLPEEETPGEIEGLARRVLIAELHELSVVVGNEVVETGREVAA